MVDLEGYTRNMKIIVSWQMKWLVGLEEVVKGNLTDAANIFFLLLNGRMYVYKTCLQFFKAHIRKNTLVFV